MRGFGLTVTCFRHFTLYYDQKKRLALIIHEWIGRGTATCDHGRLLPEQGTHPRVALLELESGEATTRVGFLEARKHKRVFDWHDI